MKSGRNVPISPFSRIIYDDCNRLGRSGLCGFFLKVPKPVLPGVLKSCGKKQGRLFLVVVERLGDAFLERFLRVTVRRSGGPAEGGEDGGADAVESAGQGLPYTGRFIRRRMAVTTTRCGLFFLSWARVEPKASKSAFRWALLSPPGLKMAQKSA